MPKNDELQKLCAGLEQFGVASAITDLTKQRFVAWNTAFLEQTGFTESEITTLEVSRIVVVTDPAIFTPAESAKKTGLIPCVVRGAPELGVLTGYLRRSKEGLTQVSLEPAESISGRDFQHGALVGQEKERVRIRQIFHQEISSPILAAIFAIATAREAAKTAAQSEPLQKASDLLTGTLEVMGAALEGRS